MRFSCLHGRPQPAVVPDTEHDARAPACIDHRRGIADVERERLLAEDMLAGGRGRLDHGPVQRVRSDDDHGLDRWIGKHPCEIGRERQLVHGRELAHLLRRRVHAAHEADALALVLNRLGEILAPAAEADDGGV